MDVSMYQTKAELFRTVGHPLRIRVLELLEQLEIEASSLSQQLAVLRRAGIVTSAREAGTACYTVSGSDAADLERAARSFLTQILAGQAELRDGIEPSAIAA